MFDMIKEWLSNLLGGASDQAQEVQQQVEDINLQEQADNAMQNVSDQAQDLPGQAAEKANEFKDNFPKQ